MEYFLLSVAIMHKEMKKNNIEISSFVEYSRKHRAYLQRNCFSHYLRCAFMYRYGSSIMYFTEQRIFKFLSCYTYASDLNAKLKNKKLCSISLGPCLDYIAFQKAFAEFSGSCVEFSDVKIFTEKSTWQKTVNFVMESIKEGLLFPLSAEQFSNVKVLKRRDIFESVPKDVLQDSDVVLMIRAVNLALQPRPEEEVLKGLQEGIKEVISSIKCNGIIFCIDNKLSANLILEVLALFSGSFLQKPKSYQEKLPITLSDTYKKTYGALPIIEAHGKFFVWQKHDNITMSTLSISSDSINSYNESNSSTQSVCSLIEKNEFEYHEWPVPGLKLGDVSNLANVPVDNSGFTAEPLSHFSDLVTKNLSLKTQSVVCVKNVLADEIDMVSKDREIGKNDVQVEDTGSAYHFSNSMKSDQDHYDSAFTIKDSEENSLKLHDKCPLWISEKKSVQDGARCDSNSVQALTEKINKLVTACEKSINISKPVFYDRFTSPQSRFCKTMRTIKERKNNCAHVTNYDSTSECCNNISSLNENRKQDKHNNICDNKPFQHENVKTNNYNSPYFYATNYADSSKEDCYQHCCSNTNLLKTQSNNNNYCTSCRCNYSCNCCPQSLCQSNVEKDEHFQRNICSNQPPIYNYLSCSDFGSCIKMSNLSSKYRHLKDAGACCDKCCFSHNLTIQDQHCASCCCMLYNRSSLTDYNVSSGPSLVLPLNSINSCSLSQIISALRRNRN